MASGGDDHLGHVELVSGVLDGWPLAVLAALDMSKLPCWVVDDVEGEARRP